MSSDTTSIMDLPTDPTGGGSIGGNVSLSINETNKVISGGGNVGGQPQGQGQGVSLDQSTINQIVNGLQQASSAGLTQLQSRDIPRNTENIIQDPQVQPNYIPPNRETEDYIVNYEENDEIISKYNKRVEQDSSLDQLYNEIQVPLLICILYFLFQLPIFRRLLLKYFPVLFFKDGNINIYGYLFTSVLFGTLYYFISKVTTHFSTF
jgi:hypothetical protein